VRYQAALITENLAFIVNPSCLNNEARGYGLVLLPSNIIYSKSAE